MDGEPPQGESQLCSPVIDAIRVEGRYLSTSWPGSIRRAGVCFPADGRPAKVGSATSKIVNRALFNLRSLDLNLLTVLRPFTGRYSQWRR